VSNHQGDNLKDFLSTFKKPGEKKKTMEEIAIDLEIAKGTLYNHFKKKDLDLNFIKLLNDKGYIFDPEKTVLQNEAEPAYLPDKKGNIIYIPLYAYGGFLHGYANKIFMDTLERFALPGIHGEHYAFEVRGESMSPYAKPGELVIARKEEKLEWMVKGDAYILQTIDGIILKIFDKIVEGKAHFRSGDKNHSSPVLPLKDIKGVYRVVKIIRDFVSN